MEPQNHWVGIRKMVETTGPCHQVLCDFAESKTSQMPPHAPLSSANAVRCPFSPLRRRRGGREGHHVLRTLRPGPERGTLEKHVSHVKLERKLSGDWTHALFLLSRDA